MARALISLAAVILAQVGLAQAFGRFGYSDLPQVPGFEIDQNGFRAKSAGSDTFKFVRPLRLRRESSSAEVAKYKCGRFAGDPQSIRVSLREPGFEMLMPFGLDLKLSSLTAPNLTVGGATYGPGTPAPAGKWVLVTFADKQPPVLLVFRGAQVETTVTGSAGDWHLKSLSLFDGWVKVCLPFGPLPHSANEVGTLGALAEKVTEREDFWTQEAPMLQSTKVAADEESVTVTWTFDRPGAIVPPSLILAKSNGYDLRTLSGVLDLDLPSEEGPVVVAKDLVLSVKFPMRRIPTGRALTLGGFFFEGRMTVVPADVPNTTELALANLLAARPRAISEGARSTLEEYFAHSVYVEEPLSKVRLPFGGDGRGMDEAAANALLMQSQALTQNQGSRDNSLLTSLLWRMDPMSWRISASDEVTARRATAVACVASSLDPEPERRAVAAMLHAGLVAESVLPRYCEKKGLPPPTVSRIDPMVALRRVLFESGSVVSSIGEFVTALTSEVRVLSDTEVIAFETQQGVAISWPYEKGGPTSLILATSTPMSFLKVNNLVKLSQTSSFGLVTLKFVAKREGVCTAIMRRPKWAKPLPLTPEQMKYSETPVPDLH